jgi:hypothetical protein
VVDFKRGREKTEERGKEEGESLGVERERERIGENRSKGLSRGPPGHQK